jgi:hypothetical protein
MNHTLLYAVVAALTIVTVFLLLRTVPAARAVDNDHEEECLEGLWDGRGLTIAERIFDPKDYHWLREEAGFPPLAESLRRSRQQMALRWLRAVRRSFGNLIRTPELPAPGRARTEGEGSWELLWMTLRFHLVLAYASFVVRYFGPYHRLVPFGWMRAYSSPFLKEWPSAPDVARLS